MRSLFSGVSGLKVHQTKMDVIGNNISNVNTTGYKSSRATFAEVFSQTLSGASAPNDATGRAGINPRQIGLGATLASISKNMTEGATQRTDIGSDLKIEGEGFFIVGDESGGTFFTRDGSFTLDKAGTLATQGGLNVYGWNVDEKGDIVKGQVEPIKIMSPENMYNAPVATDSITFSGNLFTGDSPKDSGGNVTPIERNIFFYDSLGNKYRLPLDFSFAGTDGTNNTWDIAVSKTKPEGATTEGLYMYMNGNTPVQLGSDITFQLQFDKYGKLPTNPPPTLKFTPVATATSAVASEFKEITVNFGNLTQYKESTTAQAEENGNTSGKLSSYSIGEDGKVTGNYTNGTNKLFGQIPIATFANPAGLEKKGNNLFSTTPNSGEFDGTGQDVTASGGKLSAGTLEMSNVDLSSEFTDMITTQRGFQANSKIITTSDEMLQELVNLKR